jgi:PAT family beta-lactamase induction signal transducer AmpG
MLTKNKRMLLFSSLYFAEGTIMSYFLTFNILYLSGAGYGDTDVGIFQAILVLPFLLKILLGLLSDSVNLLGWGHRKPYIVIGLLAQACAMFAAPFIDIHQGLTIFAVNAFVASIGMALYDTCTDGLALDSTPENERGIVQGLMVGARAAGILAMLLLGGRIAENYGWEWVFFIIGIMAFIPLPIVFSFREDPSQLQKQTFHFSAFKKFSNSAVLLISVIGLLYSLSLDGVLTFLSDYLHSTLNVNIGHVGALVALSMVGRIIGALSNSAITDRIGKKNSLFIAIGLASVGCAGLWMGGNVPVIAIFGFMFGLAYGYYTAVYSATAMDLCDPRISASMFAIFMMFVNLGTVGGQALSGYLTDNYGFENMSLMMGLVNLINIYLVIKVFRLMKEQQRASMKAA